MGTESWLHPETSDSEVFPPGYTPFRRYRKSLRRCVGVFILVNENFICSKQSEIRSNCELLWVRLQIAGSHPLCIGAYYKPKEDDFESLTQLREPLVLVRKRRGNIWLLGDFNLLKLLWPDNTPVFKADCSCKKVYEYFIDLVNDLGFCQLVTQPTRGGNTLDLFLTSNQTLVDEIKCSPGLSYHDIITAMYRSYKKTQNHDKRKSFLTLRKHVKRYIKTSYLAYLEGLSCDC